MRALVMGTVNDERTKTLLDIGANISAISNAFDKKLRLRRLTISDKQIDGQDIGKSKVFTTSRTTVKITLGWEVVYGFEVSIMPHHEGLDLILGKTFMIPAGIRLDLFNATAKRSDEIAIPLLRSAREVDDTTTEMKSHEDRLAHWMSRTGCMKSYGYNKTNPANQYMLYEPADYHTRANCDINRKGQQREYG